MQNEQSQASFLKTNSKVVEILDIFQQNCLDFSKIH